MPSILLCLQRWTACNFPFHVCPFRILGWDAQPFYSSKAAYDEGTVSFDFGVLECKRVDPAGIRLDPKLLWKNSEAVQRGKREIRGPDCFGFPLPFPQADYAAAGTHTCLIDSCLCLHAVLVLSALGGCYLTLGPRKLHWLLCQESMVLVGEIQQAVPSGERRAGTKGSQVPVFR